MASVGYLRDVPVGDLGGPAGDGTTQLVDLGWAGFVLEVVREPDGVSESEGGTVDPVDASDRFGCVPGCADFAVGVTSVEETTQPCLTAVADPLMEAAVRSRRIRYSGSSLRPRCPRVSFWTLRRRSSSRWLAKRMTWKGSATCTAFGSTRSYAFR